MLIKVKRLLQDKGISEDRIEEAYQFIKGSGRYPARMPSHYLAIAIELIEKDRRKPGGVQIYISPQPTKYALGRPSITFAVLALDWPGLLNSCTGTLHEKGFNVTFAEAVIIQGQNSNLGLVFMEIDVAETKEFEHLLRLEPEIKDTLHRAAAEETGKVELFKMEARKADHYSSVVEELKKIAKDTDYPDLFGEKGEAVRFFAARTLAYLTERSPQDLAHQIHTNYTFIKGVRETSKVFAKIRNIHTTKGDLTGISIAGYEHDLSMGDCFRVIDEVVPGYQRKYDKAFITDDGVNIFRIEIVDARGTQLPRDQQVELHQKLVGVKDSPVCNRFSPGVELIGRKICPVMLEEERHLKIPQVYMHPHSRSNIKVVLVTSGDYKGNTFRCIEAIGRVKGLEPAMPDLPSFVTYEEEGNERLQELAIIDVWVNFEAFFGTSKGPYDDEQILVAIEDALRKADKIGPRLRIFDRTGRQLRRSRTDKIAKIAQEKGIDPDLAGQILSRLGDRQIISPTVSDEEVFSQVLTGVEAIDRWRKEGSEIPAMTWRRTESSTAGRGASYTVFALVHEPQRTYLADAVKAASSFGLESSTVVDGQDFTLCLFRLSHQGRSLEESETRELTRRLRGIFLSARDDQS
jgi:hypothetical protein